jgi:hypothetical protein
MPEILRRREVGKHVRIDVRDGDTHYHVYVTPARGMTAAIVGYTLRIAGRVHPSPEAAEAAAIAAIERLDPRAD